MDLRDAFLREDLFVTLLFEPPARRVLQPFLAAADLFAFVIRPFFAGDFLFTVFRRVVLALRERAALLAALDLLVDAALRVLQPFLAAADLFALDGPLFVVDFRDVLLFRVDAAFLAAVDLLAALRFRVAAAFFPAADLFAAFRLRVAAAFFAAALREAFVDPLRTAFLVLLPFDVLLDAILFTFFLLDGGFTKTSVPSLIECGSIEFNITKPYHIVSNLTTM